MAIHETKKQTDLEKRLRLLRQQIYGKSSEHSENSATRKIRVSEGLTHRYTGNLVSSDSQSRSVPTQSGYLSIQADISYLYMDLLKIGILASIALGAQIILFFLTKNNILNLNLF